MALVDELLLHRGESAYAVAARNPHPGAARVALVGLVVAGLVLGVAAAEHRATRPAASADRAGLVEAVQARSRSVDTERAELARLRAGIAALRASPAPSAVPSPDPAAAAAAGLAALRGPGVAVTVDDPADRSAPRVEDRDLQLVVDGLWAAGATGVAVDGNRLTSLTAIRTAGSAVLVGYRAVSPPYTVLATGPAALRSRFVAGAGGALLSELADAYGVRWSARSRSSVALPAATASLRVASPGPTR
ncbi:uncharacterized protein YlxW (UPF0749 family) [Motilibacter peucedani]|uniref:Uncharacterized protein YlxW (UPF0749 family) n=2 Tax=Motilibacter peucedani TaxID=598650 RepID=A0A420XSN0_9ACTN|nr:uncharacterized protein YlxW (UPF0749 family) [Motilibacter peucedani]